MSGGKYVLVDKTGAMFFIADKIEQNNSWFTSNYTSVEVLNDQVLKQQGSYIKFRATLTYNLPIEFVSGAINGGQTIKKMESKTVTGYGIADVTGKIIIPPICSNVGFPDPVSGLAKVTYTVQGQDKSLYLNGYASSTEIFAIIIPNK